MTSPDTNAEGFVTQAFFQGSIVKIRRVAAILGIDISWIKPGRRKATLGISAGDRVTPDMLRTAQEEWRKD